MEFDDIKNVVGNNMRNVNHQEAFSYVCALIVRILWALFKLKYLTKSQILGIIEWEK